MIGTIVTGHVAALTAVGGLGVAYGLLALRAISSTTAAFILLAWAALMATVMGLLVWGVVS